MDKESLQWIPLLANPAWCLQTGQESLKRKQAKITGLVELTWESYIELHRAAWVALIKVNLRVRVIPLSIQPSASQTLLGPKSIWLGWHISETSVHCICRKFTFRNLCASQDATSYFLRGLSRWGLSICLTCCKNPAVKVPQAQWVVLVDTRSLLNPL